MSGIGFGFRVRCNLASIKASVSGGKPCFRRQLRRALARSEQVREQYILFDREGKKPARHSTQYRFGCGCSSARAREPSARIKAVRWMSSRASWASSKLIALRIALVASWNGPASAIMPKLYAK